ALIGLVYYVFTGPVPEKYQFTSATAGAATPGQPSSGRHAGDVSVGGNVFSYTYTVSSANEASLSINFGYYGIGGDRQEYGLHFEKGGSGKFDGPISRLGSLFTTDHGVFSPNSSLPSAPTGNTSSDTNGPPLSPIGFTYTMDDGQVPPRLVFQSASAGIEFDD